ncbi:MAG: dUTP diphosphatase [Alphaproteobacteria bacterium]
METISIQRLDHAGDLPLPAYATQGSAGMDLSASEDYSIAPGESALVHTGFAIALPPGYEAQIRPRSGLALKHGITVLNAPGTVDSDYRGELKVLLINLGREVFKIQRGHRIAQMVVAPVTTVAWQESTALPPTQRQDAGYGSTGIHIHAP